MYLVHAARLQFFVVFLRGQRSPRGGVHFQTHINNYTAEPSARQRGPRGERCAAEVDVQSFQISFGETAVSCLRQHVLSSCWCGKGGGGAKAGVGFRTTNVAHVLEERNRSAQASEVAKISGWTRNHPCGKNWFTSLGCRCASFHVAVGTHEATVVFRPTIGLGCGLPMLCWMARTVTREARLSKRVRNYVARSALSDVTCSLCVGCACSQHEVQTDVVLGSAPFDDERFGSWPRCVTSTIDPSP